MASSQPVPASVPISDVPAEPFPEDKPAPVPRGPINKNLYCVGLLLLLGNLAWFVSAFSEYWVTREDGQYKVYFTLAAVQRGPDNLVGMSWNCFAKTYCELDNQGDLCKSWQGIQNGSILYLAASGFATMFTLLLIERFVFLYSGKDAGWKWLTITLLVLVPIAQLLAVAGFFGLSEAEFNGNCDNAIADVNTKSKFCAGNGPILAIIGLLWSFITSAILFVLYFRRDKAADSGQILRLGNCAFVSNFYYFGFLLGAILCNAVMIIVSTILDDWVTRNDVPAFHGSMINCKDCDPTVKFMAYDCYAAKFCTLDSYGYCSLFNNLKNGGYAVCPRQYLYLCVASLFFVVMWVEALAHVIAGREFGLPFLNYLTPILATLFMLLAILVWYDITDASYSNTCSSPNTEIFQKPPLCPGSGPALAAASLAVMVALLLVHVVLYWFRDYKKPVHKSART